VTALFGSAFYLLLSGADVAAQRSFVMLAVMLLAMTVDRAAISMRNLAIAALIAIAISPHEILGPSFQMSYSATAALTSIYGWWSKRQGNTNSEKIPAFICSWRFR
jgi:ComEC/Rec2-related protein